ncbi:Prismane-like alpha/beta-sandwich-containing protein [Dioscorea alata]|uniref:Prismane-like alpha/beta-sandwich-containing protein n=1 Tax=Dioscorea alata TaxID=55571 RepID=A0ACB7VUB2_DIOAL|nr:Prismane-like alpha/beta-sandwich-containing protein [Dioscorea alata]
MAVNSNSIILSNEQLLMEEDFIDMDISSSSSTTTTSFLSFNNTSSSEAAAAASPPHQREFEFQMSINTPQREALTSPADELFYKGNLLPLHLPPRLQMVQKLLGNSETEFSNQTATSTPFESCNISPATSCYVSGELNPDDYFFECSNGFVQPHQKQSWARKLKLSSKLKASRAYIKSLFTKPKCPSQEPCMMMMDSKAKDNEQDSSSDHRRSFSVAFKKSLHNNNSIMSASSSTSSSSSSSSSNGFSGPHLLRRSSSVHSEVESSIEGAIDYCKMSQKLVCGRKSVSDVGFGSLSSSRISAERPGLCRG